MGDRQRQQIVLALATGARRHGRAHVMDESSVKCK